MRKQRRGKVAPKLDRWGTLNTFVRERLAEMNKSTGSPTTGLLWFVLYSMANGKDGTIRGATITRLAQVTGADRMTVRACMKRLLEADEIRVHEKGNGVAPIYFMVHETHEHDD